MSEKPSKSELPGELRRELNTLTDDAQRNAVRLFAETGLNPDKGTIPLQETLINLSETRDVLLDAIETGKFVQLPLKIQFALFDHVRAIVRELAALAAGTDAVLNLESAVEDLTAAAWQYQLHNLTGEVLGFKTKMNQLKSQETKIREAARTADEFVSLRETAAALVSSIRDAATATDADRATVAKLVESLEGFAKTATEHGQTVAALAVQVETQNTAAGQQLATAKQSAADTAAIAAKSEEIRAAIDGFRNTLRELTDSAQNLLSQSETQGAEQLSRFQASYDSLAQATATAADAVTTKADDSVTALVEGTGEKLDTTIQVADKRVTQLVTDVTSRLEAAERQHAVAIADALTAFADGRTEALNAFATQSSESLAKGDTERDRLVAELDELEGRIRTAIERATGYTLFHAFQKRQEQIASSKRFWAWALFGCVLVSLAASAAFVAAYQDLAQPTLAFYMKLSLSVPLIYAIAFCNLQYSRERKLEEEYAFKSSVSISLDPYQRLVGGLVDRENKEEMAKYTEFIIQSVNRVFTSPTEPVFEGTRRERTYAERIIKAVGTAIGTATDPLIKGLKR